MNAQDEPRSAGRSVFEVLGRRWVTASAVFLIVVVLSVLFVATYKFKYAAVAHVVLVNDQSGRDPSQAGVDMPLIVASTTVLEDVKRKLNRSESIPQLRKMITARVAPRSSIMTIVAQNNDRRFAVALPNAVAESFVEVYSALSGARYSEVTQRLRDDLAAKRQMVDVLERRFEQASAGASYVGSQASIDASASHLAELQESLGVAQSQLVADRAALAVTRGEAGTLAKAFRHEMLMNDTAYRQTEIDVGRDLGQYTTTRAAVREEYPGIAGFQDKIVHEKAALDKLGKAVLSGPNAYSPSLAGQIMATDKALAAVAGDETKVAVFAQQIAALGTAAHPARASAGNIGALRVERDAAEAQFQALALRVANAEANSAESNSLGQVVVVDRAIEAQPTLLGPVLLLILGAIAGAALAVVAAYGAEMLVPRLLAPSDIEAVYGRPILATLRSR